DRHGGIPPPVATGVALGLRQRPEPPHEFQGRRRPGRCRHGGRPGSMSAPPGMFDWEASPRGRYGPRVRAKEFRYAVDLSGTGELRTEDGTALADTPEWTPEHLVLAGLIRCSLKSLQFHAKRVGIAVEHSSGSASGMVTKPEGEERYRIVET